VSLLATVWFLMGRGISLNTMSLGGLVVALGVVVDDAVIDVENITRRRRDAPPGTDGRKLLIDASLEVRRPVSTTPPPRCGSRSCRFHAVRTPGFVLSGRWRRPSWWQWVSRCSWP